MEILWTINTMCSWVRKRLGHISKAKMIITLTLMITPEGYISEKILWNVYNDRKVQSGVPSPPEILSDK